MHARRFWTAAPKTGLVALTALLFAAALVAVLPGERTSAERNPAERFLAQRIPAQTAAFAFAHYRRSR